MYLQSVSITNLGPIEELRLTPRFDDQQRPIPIVLVGQNGAGKSLTLSVIVDAMIEAEKLAWRKINEIDHQKFFKIASVRYVKTGKQYYETDVTFSIGATTFRHEEVVLACSREEFLADNPGHTINNQQINEDVGVNTFWQRSSKGSQDFSEIKRRTPFLYYPYFRYEQADWINEDASIKFHTNQSFHGSTNTKVVQLNIIQEITEWILDLVLDRELYEKQFHQIANIPSKVFFGNYAGRNHDTIIIIQRILKDMLSAKFENIEHARFGISQKHNRQISIFVKIIDENEFVYAPTIAQMSSGETMIISLFASIIKNYEKMNGQIPANIEDLNGVVVVDEIDLHMHISLQKDMIPKILNIFKGVQFIITTHSPFLLLGLSEFDIATDIYSLPEAVKISADEFSEVKKAYKEFIKINDDYSLAYHEIQKNYEQEIIPTVITEGKTDWKHMKAALRRFQAAGQFNNLNINFLEYEDNIQMGDIKALQMCKNFSDVHSNKKYIFVFDRDNQKIIDEAHDHDVGYKRWSQNVFSFCIPEPEHRVGYRNISIELLYSDAEVKTVHPATQRRLVFDNELEARGGPKRPISKFVVIDVARAEEELDKKIYDKDCDTIVAEDGLQVAHSKNTFATYILNNEPHFDDFNYEPFRPIFENMEAIILA